MGRQRRRGRSCSCGDDEKILISSPGKGGSDKKRLLCEDGGLYEGSVTRTNNGQWIRHGEGTFTDTKGNKFEGKWEDDAPTGYGVKVFACGDMHEGGYLQGERHGSGVYVWANGDRYNGQWRHGKMHGQGAFFWNNGDVYEGSWVAGMMKGAGKKTLHDGSCFRGEFVDGKANGWGRKTYLDGESYEGQYKDDCRQGYGVYTWANGDVYEGQWIGGAAHGQGRRVNKNGVRIQGQWASGKLNGDGIKSDSVAGNVYRGRFVDDEPDGEGVLISEDFTYTGTFVSGVMHGSGLLIWADGSSYAGSFIFGCKTGYAEQRFVNGNRYAGDFVDHKRHGWGIFSWRNSAEMHIGGWKENVPNGLGCVYMLPNEERAAVTIFHGVFNHGKKDGPGVYTDEDGQLQLQEWVNGKLMTTECGRAKEQADEAGICPFCGERQHHHSGVLPLFNIFNREDDDNNSGSSGSTDSSDISDSFKNRKLVRDRRSLPAGLSRDDSFVANHRECLFCVLSQAHSRRSSIS